MPATIFANAGDQDDNRGTSELSQEIALMLAQIDAMLHGQLPPSADATTGVPAQEESSK